MTVCRNNQAVMRRTRCSTRYNVGAVRLIITTVDILKGDLLEWSLSEGSLM